MVATVFFSAIFLFMIGYYIRFLAVDSKDILNDSYNYRIKKKESTVVKGTIYSSDKKALAYTDMKDTPRDVSDDKRVYPYGKMFAHIVGIDSHGGYGIEKDYRYKLLFNDSDSIQKIVDDFKNEIPRGLDIYTTLNVGIQKKAYNELGDIKGAVFMMDPESGKIIASVSKPSYNPNTINENWEKISSDSSNSKLLNRATQGQYTPGSIFKIVTALEFMKENKNYQNYSYDCNGYANFKGFKIECFDGNAHYREDLKHAFAYSCNSAFSSIGDELKVSKFKKTAESLLFNKDLPLDITFNTSKFMLNKKSSQFDVTQTSIGQGKTMVSPAHMCMIASAIANDGVLMKPYIIKKITDHNSNVKTKTKKQEYGILIKKKYAKQLKDYMSAVCDYGTGSIMNGSVYDAYGKTGTAELDKNGHINSWFVGFAKHNGKKVAIAVVLENIEEGDAKAVNIAKEILDYYYY